MSSLEHNDNAAATPAAADCTECPVAAAGRRAFLRDVALAVMGALSASAAVNPAAALVASAVEIKASGGGGTLQSYPIPAADTIAVDVDNDVILARWQGRAYAFSIRCPHRGTRLEWLASERRVFCPKHKARFQPDGSHDSGRRSRDLDRYDISRKNNALVVNLGALRRSDEDPAAWQAAVVVVG